MPSIDERVVSMAFENAKFEAGIAQTMASLSKLDSALQKIGTQNSLGDIEKAASKVTLAQPMSALDKLKAKLGFAGNTTGFSDIEKASSKVTLARPVQALSNVKKSLADVGTGSSLSFGNIEKESGKVQFQGMSSAIDAVGQKFGALKVAAVAAMATIASRATQSGLHLLKAFTIQPVIEGFHNYETQINAVQTIMANTGRSGPKGLKQVQAALDELNTYANQTVYNFSEMAKNIGTFTAAGVDLKTATASIKGIANLAALSGSNSQQASTAMYQLSQAIAAGKVGLQDWNSVVNAGMGGKVFQQALANTAQAMGTLKDGSVKTVGPMKQLTVQGESFRNSIASKPGQKSWLTSEVLTKTLQQFTGDMSDAQLQAEGFSASQIKAIQTQAKAAVGAAVNIKTVSQLMQALKEEVATSWASVFKSLFGDIFSATAVFSKLHVAIENALTKPVYAFNKTLQSWNKLGGRALFVDALKTAFESLGAVLHTIHQAFREIFPPKTGKDLLDLTKRFHDFVDAMKPGKQTLENLKNTFKGVFSILDIGWYVVKKVLGVIGSLLGVLGHGSGGVLKFTGSIGNFLTAMDKAIVKGDALGGFFQGLTNILRVPLELLKGLASAFFGLFDGMDSKKADGAAHSLDGVSASLKPFHKIVDGVSRAWDKLTNILGNIKDKIAPILGNIGHAFTNIAQPIADAVQNADFSKVFGILNTALVGGMALTIKKAFGKGFGGNTFNVAIGDLKQLNAVFGALTGNLKAMQKGIQAATLLAIAGAVVVLAGGVALLSTIDPKKLATAMAAVATGLGQLVVALGLLSKMSKGGGFVSLPIIALGMVELAGAVLILSGAMKIMSTMSWDQIAKGLVGVGGALVAVGLGTKLMGPSLLAIGPGLIAAALGLGVLAVTMKILSSMSWNEIAKGIVGIAGGLVAMGVGLATMGPELIITGPGLVATALGVTLLAGAVSAFGNQNWDTIAKGILGLGSSLVVLGIAVSAVPRSVGVQAAGLVILAVALTGIAGAVKAFGSMDVGQLVKGLTSVAGALAIFAVGLDAMSGTLGGSAALLVAAAGLALLAPTIGFLGTLDWGTIAKGLVAIAAGLTVMGIAGGLGAEFIGALGLALLPFGIFPGQGAGNARRGRYQGRRRDDNGVDRFLSLAAHDRRQVRSGISGLRGPGSQDGSVAHQLVWADHCGSGHSDHPGHSAFGYRHRRVGRRHSRRDHSEFAEVNSGRHHTDAEPAQGSGSVHQPDHSASGKRYRQVPHGLGSEGTGHYRSWCPVRNRFPQGNCWTYFRGVPSRLQDRAWDHGRSGSYGAQDGRGRRSNHRGLHQRNFSRNSEAHRRSSQPRWQFPQGTSQRNGEDQ
jgi:tape measure domain-containing protein